MLQMQPVFGTPLVMGSAVDRTSMDGVFRASMDRLSARPSTREMPGGGWSSGPDLLASSDPGYGQLAREFAMLAEKHSVDVASAGFNRFDWTCTFEAMILPPGSRTMPSFTPGAFWSLIYCLEDGFHGSSDRDLGGDIELEDPRLPLVLMEAPGLTFAPGDTAPAQDHVVRLRPSSGRWLMFPAWLRRSHTVSHALGTQMFVAVEITAHPRD